MKNLSDIYSLKIQTKALSAIVILLSLFVSVCARAQSTSVENKPQGFGIENKPAWFGADYRSEQEWGFYCSGHAENEEKAL